MTLSKEPFDDAFTFLLDPRNSSDDTYTAWKKFWEGKDIQAPKLQQAKQEFIDELKKSNLSIDERLEKLEHIFCCDPFDKENVKELLNIYDRKRKSDSQKFNHLYHFFKLHEQEISQNQNSSQQNSQNNPPIVSQNSSKSSSSQNTPKSPSKISLYNPPLTTPSTSKSASQKQQSIMSRCKDILKRILMFFLREKYPQVVNFLNDIFQVDINSINLEEIKARVTEWFIRKETEICQFIRRYRLVFYFCLTLLALLLTLFIGFFFYFNTINNAAKQAEQYFQTLDFSLQENNKIKHEIEALEEALIAAEKLNDLAQKVNKISILSSIVPLNSLLPYAPFRTLNLILGEKIHEKNRFKMPQDSIQTMEIFPDNSSSDNPSMAISTGDKFVELWKLLVFKSSNSKKDAYDRWKNCDDVVSLKFDSTGKRIVTGGRNGKLCILTSGKSEPQEIITNKIKDAIYSVSFSPDDKLIAFAQGDKLIIVDSKEGKPIKSWTPYSEEKEKIILDISFNKKGTRIATAGKNGIIRLWEWEPSNASPKPNTVLPVQPKYITSWNAYEGINGIEEGASIKINFNELGNVQVIAENQNILNVLEYSEESKENPIKTIKLNGYGTGYGDNDVNGAGFLSKNKQLSLFTIAQGRSSKQAQSQSSFLQEWDLSEKPEYPFLKEIETTKSIERLRISEKVQSNADTVSLLALADNGSLKILSKDGKKYVTTKEIKNKKVKDMSFIPAQKRFITIDSGNNIQYWNLKPETEGNPKPMDGNITSMSVDLKGEKSAIGTKTGSIYLLENATPDQSPKLFRSLDNPIKFLAFSQNGQFLVASEGTKVKILDISKASSNAQEKEVDETSLLGGITGIELNNNQYILIGSKQSHKIEVFTLKGDYYKSFDSDLNGGINSFSFSEKSSLFSFPLLNQSLIATVGNDKKIKVWNWPRKELIAQFTSNLNTVNTIVFTSDGQEIFLGGSDRQSGKIERWKIYSLEQLKNNACQWLKDYQNQYPESRIKKYCPNAQ